MKDDKDFGLVEAVHCTVIAKDLIRGPQRRCLQTFRALSIVTGQHLCHKHCFVTFCVGRRVAIQYRQGGSLREVDALSIECAYRTKTGEPLK